MIFWPPSPDVHDPSDPRKKLINFTNKADLDLSNGIGKIDFQKKRSPSSRKMMKRKNVDQFYEVSWDHIDIMIPSRRGNWKRIGYFN